MVQHIAQNGGLLGDFLGHEMITTLVDGGADINAGHVAADALAVGVINSSTSAGQDRAWSPSSR